MSSFRAHLSAISMVSFVAMSGMAMAQTSYPPAGQPPQPAQTQPTAQTQPAPTGDISVEGIMPQTQNGVTFVTGGVGQDETDAFKTASGYNLRLTFAQAGGAFMADVHVQVAGVNGGTLVDTTADGPFFMAHLQPGSYRITVDAAGKQMTRTASIGSRGMDSLGFTW